MKKWIGIWTILLAAGILFMWQPVMAQTGTPSVDPIFVSGNPSCVGQGYSFGFKPQPEPPPSGTYTFPDPDGINTVTITSNGTYFSWTSTIGIDAVIVKGGPNANVYVYDPPTESFGDAGLHSPINPNTGQPYAISHIEFCYDYEVDVEKDAETSFTRTYEWNITKSVNPATWALFTGDDGTSEYTVSVTKTGFTDSDWAVSGTITIENNTPFDAIITGVSDVISVGINVPVSCSVTFPYTLAAGATLTCTYSADLPDGSTRTNTATVTTDVTSIVGGGEATADVIFGAPTTEVNGTINVNDTNGSSWTASANATWTYERTFACDGDEGTHNNTATITETGQSASASVTVACYALEVTKDASTSFDRHWSWTIDKTGDQTDLILSPGQVFAVNYAVAVDATSTDNNHAVSGTITITNPHPTRDAVLTGVSDLISPNIQATVSCGALTVPAGGSITCTYSADLPDASTRTNTATATLQNYSYASDGTAAANGTTSFTGTASVDFSTATITEYDECIDVNDTNVGYLGIACASTSPTTFFYQLAIGPYSEPDDCGNQVVNNTASFVTNDNGNTGEDSWTINVTVPCDIGCTLTPGYWKTHSEYGPAPYDDTWALLPNGADSPFFLSGQSYYQVLWTPPAGNVYYILSHAYIAAELNFLNGADPTAAQTAFNESTTLFETYTPGEIAELKGKGANQLRAQFVSLAQTLDDYNNGLIGPGHCSEEEEGTGYATGVVNMTTTTKENTEQAEPEETLAPQNEEQTGKTAEGSEEITAEDLAKSGDPAATPEVVVPGAYSLAQNYPNPFNPSTTFSFDLPQDSEVRLTIYNMAGQEVATVVKGSLSAGRHTINWQAPTDMASGIYLYRLQAGRFIETRKMLFLK